MRETEEKPGKEDTRLRSERRKGPFPRREGSTPPLVRTGSARGETEESGKGFWDAEELDPNQTLGWRTHIAGQPLRPPEPRMGALWPGKDRWRRDLLGLVDLRKYYLDSLVAHKLHAGSPMLSATPILPEQRGCAHLEGMEQETDPARLRRLPAVPLAWLAQGTILTLADASRIHETETAISFSTLFGWTKRLPGGTAQRAIRLEEKVLPREAVAFERQSHLGSCIARGGSKVFRGCRKGSSKLGGPHRGRRELMTQFQAQVPDPLRDDLPAFLAARGVRAPAIRVLFLVFIGKGRFKGPTIKTRAPPHRRR